MKNGKYSARRSGSKMLVLALALVLTVTAVVGGTLAWLTATSDTVTNTFTVGDISIELKETTGATYKIVPGNTAAKDPKVTVKAGSEACWLFVRIQEENNTMTVSGEQQKLVNYTVATGWTAVPNHSGYYYRTVDAVATGTTEANLPAYYVFAGDTTHANGYVTFNENIAKGQVTENNQPKIIITAAAVQKDNVADVAAAFAKLPTSFTT